MSLFEDNRDRGNFHLKKSANHLPPQFKTELSNKSFNTISCK